MILYFSGTGNSEYVAKRLGKQLNDDTMDLKDKIRNKDYSQLQSDSAWVIVAPIYCWRIPRILQDWLINTDLIGNKNIYFVLTCGGSVGNADKYLKKLSKTKSWVYCGLAEIVMPENYIAMFSTPTENEAMETINKSEIVIDAAASTILNNAVFESPAVTVRDKLSSGIVNKMFYPLFVSAKKFYSTPQCIGCGKCVKGCPTNNISLVDQKPHWGKNCTHCMACICRCPVEAIEYGKHSIGLPRYVCPKKL